MEGKIVGIYDYFADGAKFSLTDANGLTRIYLGPFTLARKKTGTGTSSTSVTLLESAEAQGAEARFAFAATPQTTLGTDTTYTVDYETLYMVKDHLGSVRVITDSMGNILERNDNYPYGLRTDLGRNYPTLPEKYRVRLPSTTSVFSTDYISETSPTTAVQPYKLLYNGKELQLMAQTPLIDYGARQYNPITTRWNAQDPMAEKLFDITPFSFCKNNSIVNIDFNGKFPWWAIIAGVAIDYGFQVYSNYQNDKSGFDAWIGDIDAVSLALSASPSGNVLKNLTKEAINSTKKAPKLTSKKRKC